MNSNAESTLVFFSLVFGLILFIFSVIKKPSLTFLNSNTHIDFSKWLPLLKLQIAIIVGSIAIGIIVTRDITTILKYIGLNLIFGITIGTKIFLIQENKQNSK